MSHTRTLVVVRHAKAEEAGATDLLRPLSNRGVADAAAAGAWLDACGIVAEHALVSAAVRTVQTWEALADGAGWGVEPTVEPALYETGPQTVLDLVHAVPDEVRHLVVVGHNPTMASLALLLEDGDGDEDTVTEMTLGFPTAATAVFTYVGRWSELGPGRARVVAFHVGRG